MSDKEDYCLIEDTFLPQKVLITCSDLGEFMKKFKDKDFNFKYCPFCGKYFSG